MLSLRKVILRLTKLIWFQWLRTSIFLVQILFSIHSLWRYAIIIPPANYDAYRTIMAVYPNANKMDEETKRLCVFFLKRGADYKDVRCLEVLKQLKVDYHKRPN